ncbi:MAG: hypothetical protein ACRC0Y_03945 [Fusobacteriaceae bacterium]
MGFFKSVLLTCIGAIPTIIIPIVLFAYITKYIEHTMGFDSVQFYAWIGFLWLIHMNHKSNKK